MGMLEQQKISFEAHKTEMSTLLGQPRVPVAERDVVPKIPKPSLQKLTAEDDVEHFLAVFERVAKQQKWSESVWATQLAGLLTGRAMAAYAALPAEEAEDFKKVREAILRRYDINEESRRRKFRGDRKKNGETHRELMTRLKENYQRWVQNQEMPMEDLMVAEQFYQSVPEDIAVWVRDRKPTSLEQIAELADHYMLSRKGLSVARDSEQPKGQSNKDSWKSAHNREKVQTSSGVTGQRSSTNVRGDKKCYQCGRYGHLMYNCPSRQDIKVSTRPTMMACSELEWNPDSRKYIKYGRLDVKSADVGRYWE